VSNNIQAYQNQLISAPTRSTNPSVTMMHRFFQPKTKLTSSAAVENLPEPDQRSTALPELLFERYTGYLSDLSDDEDLDSESDNDSEWASGWQGVVESISISRAVQPQPAAQPPRKRRRLDVPYQVQRALDSKARIVEREKALKDIRKLRQSAKTNFVSGLQGLQARHVHAMETHLHLVCEAKRNSIDASERAAEAHNFAPKWGGRQLRSWTRKYISTRDLPQSRIGRHVKAYSLLSDPAIKDELRTFVRSKKWSLNPEKLAEFTKGTLVPAVADKYLQEIVEEEMPRGLKKYMEGELLPRIHLKVGCGVSLSTARRWLQCEGFRYIGHKKGLYFDGHDRPDVLAYRQDIFLPAMKAYSERLVQYVVNDVDTQVPLNLRPGERPLVLVAHDEMTAQANDARAKSWVLEDQHALRKKGVGRGIHKSDVICSTVGWLKDASQTLEYGKNYEGYWTGELFVKQVKDSKNICVQGLK